MKWENKLLLVCLVLLVFVFPVSAGYLDVGFQIVWDMWAQVRPTLVPVPIAYIVGWVIYKYNRKNGLNIPKNTAKTKKAGKYIDSPML